MAYDVVYPVTNCRWRLTTKASKSFDYFTQTPVSLIEDDRSSGDEVTIKLADRFQLYEYKYSKGIGYPREGATFAQK